MTRWTFALSCLLAGSAVAADTAADQGQARASNPMAAWKQPKLTQESKDKQEIAALFQKMEQAGKEGDLGAAVALIDFPVLMATDDSRGEAHAQAWSREQWAAAMKPFYAKPMSMQVKHEPTISVLSDSLATVVDHATFTMGGKNITTRSSSLLVRKGGEWKIKSMVEGGWGDAMSAAMAKGASESATGTGAGEPQKQ
jgi:hypothetical protein